MKTLSSVLSGYKTRIPEKSKITNNRQTIVKKFLDRLNAARAGVIDKKTGKEYKPLSAGFIGTRMRFMSTQELYQFYGYCAEAKNFSATWWWATNPKNYPLDKNAS